MSVKKLKNSKFKILKLKALKVQKRKIEEQKNILYSLHLLLKQGYSLNESVRLVSYRLNLQNYIEQLSEGINFSEILNNEGFDKDVLLILEISEKSGQFKEGIEKSLLIIEKKSKNKNMLWEQLKYPLMLATIMLLGIGFLSNFLIPTFKNVYESFGIELSTGMKIGFLIIEILPKLLIIVFIVVAIIFLYIKAQDASTRLGIFTKYKIFRKQYYKIYNQIFILNLTSLLELGLKFDEIFPILSNQKYNYLLKKESEIILKEMYQGSGLTSVLKKRKIYNDDLIQIIEDGENNGTLVENLQNYLLINEIETKKKAEKYIFLIQPIFYGIFGLMIVFLYASIFVPMFEIMDSI